MNKYKLTNREKEIFSYKLKFLDNTNKEIGEKFCISGTTIKSHIENIYRKFNLKEKSNTSTLAKVIMKLYKENLLEFYLEDYGD